MKDYERIKNLEQCNWYLSKLNIPIRVGIEFDKETNDRKFYIAFFKSEKYLTFKKEWMSGSRTDRYDSK